MTTLSTQALQSRRPPAPALQRWPLSRLVLVAAALALLLVWASVGALLRMQWNAAVEGEVRQNANLARALQEQTLRVIATVDQATRRLRDAVRDGNFNPEDLPHYANETGLVPTILVQLSLVGPDGRFLGSNLDPMGRKTGQMDLSEREHIRVHLRPDSVPDAAVAMGNSGLFIGKPVLGKVSGRWTLQLSRRIDGADGRVLGVVVASLDPGYFEEVYRGVSLGAHGVVTLAGRDLVVRARVVGGTSQGLGSSLGSGSASAQHMTQEAGDFIGHSGIDQRERIWAFRHVADTPLYIFVATATQEALAAWRETRDVVLVLTALLSAAVLGAAATFLGGVRRLERKNEALRLSEAQAQSASHAKSEFLAAVSHELRTPLTSIRGYAELMETRLEHPVFREHASLIRKGAEHLNALLTQILDLAKVEAGAMPVTPMPVALQPLLQGTLDFFALTARDKGLALELRLAEGLPATLSCDELRLKQVLNNLLSNALKFTTQGSVALEAERAGDTVRLHVVDTGPGIPPELHETVFEKFRQADAQVAYEHGGTGLGLALSRALAQLMGGTLTLQSAPGRGARFTLALPLREDASASSA